MGAWFYKALRPPTWAGRALPTRPAQDAKAKSLKVLHSEEKSWTLVFKILAALLPSSMTLGEVI